ncbi:MAG: hypothetical protein PVH00_13500 [Gemmatimonadota bacterium]|jgi:hypothetical protein
MNGQQVPATALRVIRLALLSGVLLFGVVIAYLTRSGEITPDPAIGAVLRIVFVVLAAVCIGAIFVIRTAQSRADPDRRGQLAIVGWAFAEGTAILGGVCWLLAGLRVLYFTGVALLVAAILLLPVADDA